MRTPPIQLSNAAGIATLTLLLAGCGSQPARPVIDRAERPAAQSPKTGSPTVAAAKPLASPPKRGGGYYQDDGPGENAPSAAELEAIPDAEPKVEPMHRFANKPYAVFGRDYVPMTRPGPYKAQGIGSWYGRKFHGQKTSSGEIYDMFGMTAAHPTLPIPSYVRVTNPANGQSVIVRVNDRGPFHSGRLIDLSYTAAWKLGYIGNGSTFVEVESVMPGDTLLASRPATANGQAMPALIATRTPNGTDDDPIALLAQQQTPATAEIPAALRPAPLPESRDSHGVYLQLGAFGNPENAENLKARLERELAGLTNAAEFANKLGIQPRAGIYRLQLGPWRDHVEAQRIADRLREAFDLKPVVVRP